MSAGPKAGALLDIFMRAARGEMEMIEVIDAAGKLVESDRRLGIALYSAWLVTAKPPLSAMIWFNLGLLIERENDLAQAKEAFRESLRIMPNLRQAQHALLRVLMLDSKRQVMRDGRPDEAYLLCCDLLGGGALACRRTPAQSAELGETIAYYAFLLEFHGWEARAEYLYEIYLAEGGSNSYFSERLAALAMARRARRESEFGAGETRLRCLSFELVDGGSLSSPMMTPETADGCLANLDVDSVFVLRLFARGEPLLHTRLLAVLSAIEGRRRGPVRIDVVEVWTDGHDLDMVQLEDALRCRSIDSIVVHCEGDGTGEGYRSPRSGGRWSELVQFLDMVANYRRIHDLDMALRAWIRADRPEDRARWSDLMRAYGWQAEFAAEGETLPLLIDGAPPFLRDGDGLSVGADGCLDDGASLLRARFSEIAARRAAASRKFA